MTTARWRDGALVIGLLGLSRLQCGARRGFEESLSCGFALAAPARLGAPLILRPFLVNRPAVSRHEARQIRP